MIGFALDSGALAGLISILVTVVILALIAARIMGRDALVRIARIGVFIERQRLPRSGEEELEVETQEWPEFPATGRALPLDRQDTVELPPEEEK